MNQGAFDEWMDRALELSRQTILPKRRAEVQALREEDYWRGEIDDELGLSPSTVSEHFREIDALLEEAWAAAELIPPDPATKQ